ncbi:MAG TPA: hypothetical protein VHE35_23665, partial [Kofleriaceae bacterium]|nr:hypothetical protein [Kofleriaceae bacterium]
VLVARFISRRGLCNGYLALAGVASARALFHALASAPPSASAGPSLADHRPALLACVAVLAIVAVGVTTVRDRAAGGARQPWPVLTALVVVGESLGLVLLAATGVAAMAGLPVDLGWLARLAVRPPWFDALAAIAVLALLVAAFRLPRTPLAIACALLLLASVLCVRAFAPADLGISGQLLPALGLAFLAVELVLALSARLGLRRPVAILAVHDVDRADRAADALRAAGIAASVENLRFRAAFRGLAAYAPIVIRVAADDAARATATVAAAEADADPRVATFAA